MLVFLLSLLVPWAAADSESSFARPLNSSFISIHGAYQPAEDGGDFRVPPAPVDCRGQAPDTAPRPLAACLRDPACHDPIAVAHRGRGVGAVENSRDAMRRVISSGLKAVEFDLRFSKDGQLFVIHDPKLDRTTSMTGEVSGYTAAELSQARLANGEALPRFDELYALTRGKAIVDLHLKNDVVEPLARWIGACGSFDDVIFFVSAPGELASAARMVQEYPRMIVMADVTSWDDAELVRKTLGRRPDMIHVAHTRWFTKDLVDKAHAQGVKFFTNSFVDERVPLAGRLRILEQLSWKVDFFQGDYPFYLADLLHKNR